MFKGTLKKSSVGKKKSGLERKNGETIRLIPPYPEKKGKEKRRRERKKTTGIDSDPSSGGGKRAGPSKGEVEKEKGSVPLP